MEINIKISELEQIFKLLICKLNDEKIEEIKIIKDHYWKVQTSESFEFPQMPEQLNVGSLIVDWEELQRTISQENIFTFVDFDPTGARLCLVPIKMEDFVFKNISIFIIKKHK